MRPPTLLVLSTSVLYHAGTGSAAPAMDALDLAVLDAFYHSTGGPTSWLNTSGWATLDEATLSDPCTWYGVACLSGVNGTRGSRCTHLDMKYNNLTGRLPSILGNLTHLEVLDLGSVSGSGNHLRGSLNPPDVADVCRLGTEGRGLTTLALRAPDCDWVLGDCPGLHGVIPDCDWPALAKLDLTRNGRMSGTIPQEVRWVAPAPPAPPAPPLPNQESYHWSSPSATPQRPHPKPVSSAGRQI